MKTKAGYINILNKLSKELWHVFYACKKSTCVMANKARKFHFTRPWKIVAAIVLILIIFRLLLPSIILHYCNKSLAEMHGYYGHVEDIDVALYRGAYQINNIYINKVDSASKKQT